MNTCSAKNRGGEKGPEAHGQATVQSAHLATEKDIADSDGFNGTTTGITKKSTNRSAPSPINVPPTLAGGGGGKLQPQPVSRALGRLRAPSLAPVSEKGESSTELANLGEEEDQREDTLPPQLLKLMKSSETAVYSALVEATNKESSTIITAEQSAAALDNNNKNELLLDVNAERNSVKAEGNLKKVDPPDFNQWLGGATVTNVNKTINSDNKMEKQGDLVVTIDEPEQNKNTSAMKIAVENDNVSRDNGVVVSSSNKRSGLRPNNLHVNIMGLSLNQYSDPKEAQDQQNQLLQQQSMGIPMTPDELVTSIAESYARSQMQNRSVRERMLQRNLGLEGTHAPIEELSDKVRETLLGTSESIILL